MCLCCVAVFKCKMHLPFVPFTIRSCIRFSFYPNLTTLFVYLYSVEKMIKCFWFIPFHVAVLFSMLVPCTYTSPTLVVQVLMQFADLDRIKFSTDADPVHFIDSNCVVYIAHTRFHRRSNGQMFRRCPNMKSSCQLQFWIWIFNFSADVRLPKWIN